ncbi:hydantoinase B/oxoprolinase family protein [Pelagibius sp.]|uniref:hydantoinase B/oxoprolinase family protein n=1 Tax=Pelagibius sp. TaxID=1931238 RepID=UPI003BAFC385
MSGKSIVQTQVMWDRLIALVEDQASTLMRTAFSPIVRESGDLSAGIFDTQGRMLAQARTGTPGHINTMAASVGQFLEVFPTQTIRPGDVFVTNDPWAGAGHLNDFVVVTPAFFDGKLVALFACTGHMTDVGGIGLSPEAADLFAEGTRIPISKLADQGKLNETLIEIAKANSRLPFELEGDIYALMASNDVGVQRLADLLSEVEQSNIVALADHIVESSRRAVEAKLAALPNTNVSYRMMVDGFEEPIELVAELSVAGSRVRVDWTGSSAACKRGINVPLGYAAAYTSYALACAIAPDVPNNHGTLSVFEVTAPAGSILDARFPQPVSCRHIVGGLLPDVVLGCIDQIIPGIVPAESASALWTLTFRGGSTAEPFAISIVTNGGTGARPTLDGLSATSFPSAVRGTPVEMVEASTPLIFWRRELRPDSGGTGRHRGGLGQEMEIGTLDGNPFTIVAAFDRIKNPARGRSSGGKGAPGELHVSDGTILSGKGAHVIDPDNRLRVRTPGGGGYGPPEERHAEERSSDLSAGYVTTGEIDKEGAKSNR